MNDREYLLTCLMEELAEITEVCGKIGVRASKMLRFGSDETQPGHIDTNAQRLVAELADLIGIVKALENAGLITLKAVKDKRHKLNAFMAYSRKCGTLIDNPEKPADEQ